MIRINLLPHREEKRKARRQQFFMLLGAVGVAAAVIVVIVHSFILGYIAQQTDKNEFLKKEIAALEKEIDEIKRLKEQTDALLSRKRVIESLQGRRTEAVQIFNELARKVPEGVFIKSIKQQGNQLTLVGVAQSNARVSTLMRNLESTTFFSTPVLIEITSGMLDKRRVSQFSLTVAIAPRKADEEEAAKGAKA